MSKRNRFSFLRMPALILGGLIISPQAFALLETCEVSAVGVNFGIYNPISGGEAQGIGEVEVTCSILELTSLLVSYEIKLSTGNSGNYFPREMVSGARNLEYQLYTEASRSSVWGDGAGGTSTVSDGYLLGILAVTRTYPIYGSIPANQMVAAGSYADTITVTLYY